MQSGRQRFQQAMMLSLAIACGVWTQACGLGSGGASAGTEVGESSSEKPGDAWREDVLVRAGDNRAQIGLALDTVPQEHRMEMEFLVRHMPERDLKSLSAAFLRENVRLAREARERAPWGKAIPDEVYLNDVVPYASVSETREDWRPGFAAEVPGLIAGAQTPGEAADMLNRRVFNHFKVHYNTERERADQSPSESIRQGKASCTGLAILLVNACRAVGVPARLAGVYEWSNKPGNHTWVEVWDGQWKFVGADEPDDKGFNHAWFVDDAARADASRREHAVWAASWRETGESMPLAFAPEVKDVPGENVTARYVKQAERANADATMSRVFVRVLGGDGKRVATEVHATRMDIAEGRASSMWLGSSRDETRDLNDLLEFAVPLGSKWRFEAPTLGISKETEVDGPTKSVTLEAASASAASSVLATFREKMIAWFDSSEAGADSHAIDLTQFDAWVAANPGAARQAAWEAFARSKCHDDARREVEEHTVRAGGYESPYVVREVGRMPASGWPLFIAMHGGGGVEKSVNDRQWQHMQTHYRDHPELGGYLYLALRAPTDEWNGFYTDYMYPLVERLIASMTMLRDVNPDRVYIMGYSHGGYGAFAIGPKMPDRFAAIHASAAAPTDSETSPKTLLSTRMTYMVGEHDTAYDRLNRNRKFDARIRELRAAHADAYPVEYMEKAGYQHSNLPDHDMIAEMYTYERNPGPKQLCWEQTDSVIRTFFWIEDVHAAKGREINARIDANTITLTTTGGVRTIRLHIDERHVDPSKPVTVRRDNVESVYTLKPSAAALARSMRLRGDPSLASTGTIELPAATN